MSEQSTFYHCTRRPTAEKILKDGFRDGTGTYLTMNEYSGVWLSDIPLDASYGISGFGKDDVILKVTLLAPLEHFADYEWVEEIEDPDTGQTVNMKGYREWLVPAEKINGAATVELLDDED